MQCLTIKVNVRGLIEVKINIFKKSRVCLEDEVKGPGLFGSGNK